ncbi:DUF2938 domain-containing protein [Ramlibacter sp.]|uniref:DUF2938 domain-containing protein n=1 Tax=Ramlibacter sp. TaxID=1917967 RepID=UPI002FCA06CA
MTPLAEPIARIFFIGIGATALLDLWSLLLKRLNVPTLDFALLGRWAGHLAQGRWAHDAIAKAPPVRGELAIGWLAHYAIGVAFAALLVAIAGTQWLRVPTLLPAVLVGVATVAAPLFVMQPAMGAGIASSRTRTPALNCLKSVANHTVFGAGLYLAAAAIAGIA